MQTFLNDVIAISTRAVGLAVVLCLLSGHLVPARVLPGDVRSSDRTGESTTHDSVRHDVSPRLARLGVGELRFVGNDETEDRPGDVSSMPPFTPDATSDVEQTSEGTQAPAKLVESFDGLGVGFTGPQGTTSLRNPSDNSLAVGPDHIVQTVNTRMAVFTKKGKRYDSTGKVLYGPVVTNAVFRGFGGQC